MQRKKIIYITFAVILAAIVLFVFRNALACIFGLLLSSFIQAYIFLPFVKSLEKRVPRPAAIILAFVLTGAVNAAVERQKKCKRVFGYGVRRIGRYADDR